MNTLERFTQLFIFVAIWVPALWAQSAKAPPAIGIILALASLAATVGYLFILKKQAESDDNKKS